MSVVHDLQGIKVLPSPALRDGDFNGRNFFKKNPNEWPKGFAFGGWVYDASVQLGFSKRPTQLTLNIVLENDTSINEVQQFDIDDRLLQVSLVTAKQRPDGTVTSSQNFNAEFWEGHYYSIYLHGVKFNRMYLYDYSISVDAGQKTLMVSFKDYSVILDKIYVGLMKRQGPARVPSNHPEQTNNCFKLDDYGKCKPLPLCGVVGAQVKRSYLIREGLATTSLTSFCPNCYLMGDGFNSKESTEKSIKGSYGGNLGGFFNKVTGTIKRDADLASFIGRPSPQNPLFSRSYDNLIKSQSLDMYKASKACYLATQSAWATRGGAQPDTWWQQIWAVTDDGNQIDCTNTSNDWVPNAGGPHIDFHATNPFNMASTLVSLLAILESIKFRSKSSRRGKSNRFND